MTLRVVIAELFSVLPSRTEGALDIASEIGIWERELADLPLVLLEGTSRAFMRGDIGVPGEKGKHWRPPLSEFRSAAIKRGGIGDRGRQYPLVPPAPSRVITFDEHHRVIETMAQLREELRINTPEKNNLAGIKLSNAIQSSLGPAANAPHTDSGNDNS